MRFFPKGAVCPLLIIGLFSGAALAQIGDGPIIKEHLNQSDIESGAMTFDQIFKAGGALFKAKFNTFDGQGRPGSTGTGAPRTPGSAPAFIRTSAPESNSCAGCHNDPFVGAAGDIVANVFVLAQALDPVTESVSAQFSNDRNTLGMHGAGPIEMLAREMTADLLAIRNEAMNEATFTGQEVTKTLVTKGVHFGSLVAKADGSVDASGVEGVDEDLIIRPFHQKGAVISIRQFTNNAMNHHHGMQSTERFGFGDPDQDGYTEELTVGDITATTIWQASLQTPGQIIPDDPAFARAIIKGERTFSRIGCGDCHVPELPLSSSDFTEPNPYNPDGNLKLDEVAAPYTFDMTQTGPKPRLEGLPNGTAVVRAFTDLKRHNLCDEELNHFCNEEVEQDGIDTRLFLTRKLWDVGNTAPYGHRGDLTTLTEAIYYHGGDARESRDLFFQLPQQSQDEVIEFLKSLQILPAGAESLVVDQNLKKVNKESLRQKFATPEKPAADTAASDLK